MVLGTVEKIKNKVDIEPKFRNISELTKEQLTDPDYRLKQIAKEAGIPESQVLNCSKCHHCR